MTTLIFLVLFELASWGMLAMLDQQIVIPVGAFLGLLVGLLTFLLTHLLGAIWFASKMNTKVGLMTVALSDLQEDVKALVKFDTKIEVLHERMNQSQADRSRLWEAVVDLRRTVSTVQLRSVMDDRRDMGEKV